MTKSDKKKAKMLKLIGKGPLAAKPKAHKLSKADQKKAKMLALIGKEPKLASRPRALSRPRLYSRPRPLGYARPRFESRPRAQEAEKRAASPAQEQGSRLKKVRFTKDVPAYMGTNSQTFGPFKNGDEGTLPPEEAEWLLRGKLAEPSE